MRTSHPRSSRPRRPAAAHRPAAVLPVLIALGSCLLLASCAGMRPAARAPQPGYSMEMDEALPSPEASPALAAESRSAPAAEDESMKISAPAAGALAASSAQPAGQPEPPAAAAAGPQQAEARKRVYTGNARLAVDDPEERKKRIALLVEEAGGYVEASYEQAVVVRVPAERFAEIFQRILGLGEVLQKSVETQDVTEAFSDLQARLAVSEKTRERLYALLEKTGDVEERLKILREIKRLSEEIERIRLTLDLLERQIAFSRINVALVPRLAAEQPRQRVIPFRWIAGLNPIYPSLGRLSGPVQIELGDEFAVFGRERIFRAESPEGTRVRIATTANRPQGDADFWQKALLAHLGGYYRSAEPLQLGEVRAVLFTSKDREPFRYLVGVLAGGKELQVFEVFFPNETAALKRMETIRAALSRVKGKGR